jgi:CheY-like chemotaxis protein
MSRSPANPPRCLLIEDDEHAAESLGMLLSLEGYEVSHATDGAQGLELARSLRPRAVICDMSLPGDLDGFAVGLALRAEPGLEGMVLVGLSGYGEEEDLEQARKAGFDSYLVKPVELESVRRALAKAR